MKLIRFMPKLEKELRIQLEKKGYSNIDDIIHTLQKSEIIILRSIFDEEDRDKNK